MQNNNTPPKLLDQVRDRIRVKHYSIRTEAQYVQWIKRFILFNGKRHPLELGAGSRSIFIASGGGREGIGFNTESGVVCFAVFI